MPTMRCFLFFFKDFFPVVVYLHVFFFKQPLLVIRMNLTVLWNDGDCSKAKFFKMLFIPFTITSHPLNTEDRCQRGKNQHKWKDHQK